MGLRTRLLLPGKLGNRRGVNSLGGLTYLTDSLSNTRFLVDTGAALSVIPYAGNRPAAADASRERTVLVLNPGEKSLNPYVSAAGSSQTFRSCWRL